MMKYIAFLKVAECRSFTLAAKELKYTQSAISQMIRTLEEELHVKLFLRSKTGLELTYEGAVLLPYVRSLVNSYQSLIDRNTELNTSTSGIIRLGLFATFTDALLPKILKKFHQDYPDVRFELHQGYYYRIREWLEKDQVSFALINTNFQGISNYNKIPLLEDPIYLLLPEDSEFCQNDVIPLSDLEGQEMIALTGVDDEDYSNHLKEIGIHLNIQYHMGDDNSILTCVKDGLGMALMPKLGFLNRIDEMIYRPTDPPLSRPIGIVYKKETKLSQLDKIFIQYIQEAVQEYTDTT